MSDNVKNFIDKNWENCIRHNRKDDGTFIGMPYPYTVPAVGHFEEMYYWDTYFTNIGLMISGRYELAKSNTDNMLYLINKYGFMPNGNRTFYLGNSQPPFLSCMVKDIYDYYRDPVWLSAAYDILKKEYSFWQTKRLSAMGLNHYDGTFQNNERDFADAFFERVGIMPDIEQNKLARHTISCCESGWDMNPRWGCEGYNFAPVDLNSLLFMLEQNMAFFALELNNREDEEWNKRAELRRHLMLEKMDDGSGLLLDYNFEKDSRSCILSAASFFPLFAGLADASHADAMIKNLNRIESKNGILACEKNNEVGIYQWSYPNGWACLQYIAIIGLDNYGYKPEAKRIAEKYVKLVDKIFEETGNIWEKYNVVNGSLEVSDEYKQPAMMGWSAGVYLAADKYLSANNE